MIETPIGEIAALVLDLQRLSGVYESLEEQSPGSSLEAEALSHLDSQLDKLRTACSKVGFSHARNTLNTALQWTYPQSSVWRSHTAAQREIAHVLDAIQHELEDRKFYHLFPDRSKFFDQPRLFGDAVYERFPSARQDIQEAGNCIATDRNTAAVFHLMRAVEWGLRALCGDLKMNSVHRRKRSGERVWIPLEWSDWETILNQLAQKVDERIDKVRRGPQKQAAQEFYYPALQDIRGIKDAFRNHVMHTRKEYTAESALTQFQHVKRLMSALAERITGVEKVRSAAPKLEIEDAQYGIGGMDYLNVTEMLRGYLSAGVGVLASNHFFTDPYPDKHKHLLVKVRKPRSRKAKMITFLEGMPVDLKP